MAKAVKSEIMAMRSSNIVDVLRKDADDAKDLCRAIDKFVSNSSRKLSGQNYDEARAMAAQYIPILQSRAQAADAMADAIKSGCLSLAWYMGPFAVLDEALRAEYEQKLRAAEAELAALESWSWDDEDNRFFDWQAYFTCKKIIEECKLYLEKLDGLPGADSSAYGPISEAASGFVIN